MKVATMEEAPSRWETFGKWLRAKRRALDLTQEEAAQRAGLTRQQWNRLEAGESGTQWETIPRIATALGVSAQEAYRQAGFVAPEMPGAVLIPSDGSPMHAVNKEGMPIQLSPEQQRDLLNAARVIQALFGGELPSEKKEEEEAGTENTNEE